MLCCDIISTIINCISTVFVSVFIKPYRNQVYHFHRYYIFISYTYNQSCPIALTVTKKLGKTTKGELCQQCYRHRNNNNYHLIVDEKVCEELYSDDINNSFEINKPKLDDNDDRSLIDFLKDKMIQEHNRERELISIMKDQINFMKDEINHKNDIIHKLISDLSFMVNCEKKQHPFERNVIDSNNISYCNTNNIVNENNNHPYSNYMQYQPVNETCRDNSTLLNDLNLSAISSNESFFNEPEHVGLSTQLSDARNKYHQIFLDKVNKGTDYIQDNIPAAGNDPAIWPSKTTLIVGDSIISGINEKRLSRNNKLVRVRSFPGAKVQDMFHYLVPLIIKRPDNIIIHCGTNNSDRSEAQEIVDDLLKLKLFILERLPECNIIFSHPTVRIDKVLNNNRLKLVRNFLKQLKVDSICNENITLDCLGKSKLHLNAKGTARLAMNFKSFIRHI